MIFRAADDGRRYSAAWAEYGIEFMVDRLHRERHDLIGELAVSCGILGTRAIDGALSIGTFNLSRPYERARLAKLLSERARTRNTVDWHGLAEAFCQRVLKAEREGTPAVVLRELPKTVAEDAFTIEGLCLPSKHASIVFGDGGTGKSYLLLYVGGVLARAGLRVLYLDWELDAHTHRDRLERLFGPDLPDVRYVRCERPMVYEVDRLAKIIERDEIEYGLFDSVGFACDGPPEAAESALGYFRAVRQLRIGGLHSAHTRRKTQGDVAEHERQPFGSAFWHNAARSTWFVKLAATDGDTITIGLFHRKTNLGRLQPAVGFEIDFSDDRTEFRPIDVRSVDALSAELPLNDRIREVLRHGSCTVVEILERLGLGQGERQANSVRAALRRGRQFTRLPKTDDGIHRWGLAELRAVR